MKETNKYISHGIIRSIADFWGEHNLEDFQVEIDGKIINCHSFILASCSGFFRSLFRSGMREAHEKKVYLHDISAETFEVILEALYTGVDVVTEENVIGLLKAADQLQISFLSDHCGDFICDHLNLETFDFYYSCPQAMSSRIVQKGMKHFILENFTFFVKTETFLKLDFEYLLKLVANNNLDVKSEDIVVYSIYKWVEYGQLIENSDEDSTKNELLVGNEESLTKSVSQVSVTAKYEVNSPIQSNVRQKYLAQLLGASRLCLATSSCLYDIYNREITQSDLTARNTILQALAFQTPNYLHGFWPKESEHRYCSCVENVGVFCHAQNTVATFIYMYCPCVMPHRPLQADQCQLVVHNKELYSFDRDIFQRDCVISVLKNQAWETVIKFPSRNIFLLAHNKFIYLFDTDTGEISRFDPKKTPTRIKTCNSQLLLPTLAISYQQQIIVFSSVTTNDVRTTEVSSWDTATDTWSRLENFQGSGNTMVSFNHYQNVYILESNGSLWQMTTRSDGVIGFIFLKQVWNLELDLRGAFLYGKTLILGSPFNQKVKCGVYSELFTSIRRFRLPEGVTSNFVHFVYPEKFMPKLYDP